MTTSIAAIDQVINDLIKHAELPQSFRLLVDDIYLPLAEIINQRWQQKQAPLFVSVNGAQGSGKSTLTEFLKVILETAYERSAVSISIDDFYLTRQQREHLSKTIHPLLLTRGVPGTHDLPMMEQVFKDLLAGRSVYLPRFDKAQDDRLIETTPALQTSVDIILFEGWCNNSLPESQQSLSVPVNELEINEDPDGSWREFVNQQLKLYQKKVFSLADLKIMLLIADFELVYQWRKKQEDKLRGKQSVSDNKVMNEQQLQRFIQHYERITRNNIAELPGKVDIVLPLNKDHCITEIRMQDHE